MVLITSASANNETTSGNDVITGTSGPDAFIIDNTAPTGQDTITFGKNDSFLFKEKLFDSNNDGIITFGSDKKLDVFGDVSGNDEISVIGVNPDTGIRYLGSKDGYFVYANAAVRQKGFTEGTVNNDTFDATKGDKKFFYDTALGLNLGDDTITNFTLGDKIITTSAIYDSNNDGIIDFGSNGLLDLPGASGGTAANLGFGGTIDIDGVDSLAYLGSYTKSGVTYYEYGLHDTGAALL